MNEKINIDDRFMAALLEVYRASERVCDRKGQEGCIDVIRS